MKTIKSTWPINLNKSTKIKKNSSVSVLRGNRDADFIEVKKNKLDKINQKIIALKNEIWLKKMARLNKKK